MLGRQWVRDLPLCWPKQMVLPNQEVGVAEKKLDTTGACAFNRSFDKSDKERFELFYFYCSFTLSLVFCAKHHILTAVLGNTFASFFPLKEWRFTLPCKVAQQNDVATAWKHTAWFQTTLPSKPSWGCTVSCTIKFNRMQMCVPSFWLWGPEQSSVGPSWVDGSYLG